LLFTPDIPNLGSGFLGSAVVSSGQEAACSVNTQIAPGTGTNRVGTSEGLSADATGPKLFATQVVNALAGFNSYVAVQNAESTATTVKATIFNQDGTEAATQTETIEPNSSHVFYQDASGLLPANFIGSATFESTDGTSKLAGAVAMYNTGTAQLLSFNTFTSGASKIFLPRLSKNLSGRGYTSGFACQNVGPGSADMQMVITMRDQDTNQIITATMNKTGVGVGQSWGGYLGSNNTGTAVDNIVKGTGSAVVTSTGGLVACTANEDNRSALNGPDASLNGQGSTYGGVPDGEQSNIMEFPQIVSLGDNSYRGGFQIANTTGTDTTCTYTFSNGDVVSNQSLAANSSNSLFAPNLLTNNTTTFNGSVRVECGQPIVGIYNLSIIGPAASGDPFATNNGINK
jgi:hypothetical protein